MNEVDTTNHPDMSQWTDAERKEFWGGILHGIFGVVDDLSVPETADLADYVTAWNRIDSATNWIKGDLIAQLARVRGEATLERFAEEVGVPVGTVRSLRAVAVAYPASSRRSELSWSVHQVLASQDNRAELIAGFNGTVKQARELVSGQTSVSTKQEPWKTEAARKERERVERQSARDRARFKAEAESTPETPAEAPVDDEQTEGHQDTQTPTIPAAKPRQRSNWPKDTTLESVTFNRGTSMTLTFADGSVMGASNGMFHKENRDGRKYQEVVKLMADMWQTRWVELDQAVREIYREHLEGETK